GTPRTNISTLSLHDALPIWPENIDLPAGLSDEDHAEREHLRQYLSERFNRGRDAEQVQGYNSAYSRVKGLMRSDALFDLEREPADRKSTRLNSSHRTISYAV